MEAILVMPSSERQVAFRSVADGGTAEEDVFYPGLQEKIDDAMARRADGKAVRIDTSSFDNFVASIRDNG